MKPRLALALMLVLATGACGVKNALTVPGGPPPGVETPDEDTLEGRGPSLPPQPLGQ